MNNRIISNVTAFLVCLFFSSHMSAQELTLEQCRQMAHDNYPAIKQYGLIEQSRDLTISNASKAWLPGVSVSGFGIVMSDALESSPLGDMENTIYGASVTVSQVLYDGGSISAQKGVLRAKSEVEKAQTDVQLYAINERVEQLYFGILMIDEQIKQVALLQNNLSITEKTVNSMINGGLANQNDLDQVHVNQITAEQQLVKLNSIRRSYMQMLGYFIGQQGDLSLQKPSDMVSSQNERPELSLFSSQEEMLTSQRKALNSKVRPTLSAFGMAAYHNEIMPIMKSNNLMAGVMLKWNIGALYSRKNDISALTNQQQQIAIQREAFLFNNNLQQQQSNGQIESLREQMKLDDKVVALRENILEKSRKKVEMGTETVNEMLRNVNAVSEARQQRAIHEIQLLQEIYKLNTIKGK